MMIGLVDMVDPFVPRIARRSSYGGSSSAGLKPSGTEGYVTEITYGGTCTGSVVEDRDGDPCG